MRHRARMGDEFRHRHHPPFLPLVAKADRGDFLGQDGAVKHPGLPAVASGKGEDYVPMLSDWIAGLNGTSLAGKG